VLKIHKAQTVRKCREKLQKPERLKNTEKSEKFKNQRKKDEKEKQKDESWKTQKVSKSRKNKLLHNQHWKADGWKE